MDCKSCFRPHCSTEGAAGTSGKKPLRPQKKRRSKTANRCRRSTAQAAENRPSKQNEPPPCAMQRPSRGGRLFQKPLGSTWRAMPPKGENTVGQGRQMLDGHPHVQQVGGRVKHTVRQRMLVWVRAPARGGVTWSAPADRTRWDRSSRCRWHRQSSSDGAHRRGPHRCSASRSPASCPPRAGWR